MNSRYGVYVVCFIFLATGLVGCGQGPAEHRNDWENIESEDLTGPVENRYDRAEKARKALAKTLFGRLSEVMSKDGPAGAIRVCNMEAQGMTDDVGDQFNVNIGRTSFRLRNPNNTPPDWARQHNLVKERIDQQTVLKGENGSVAVFTPIRLKENCVACHGPEERINREVKQKLAELYPRDEATGFRPGELRGWFWVEAPATDSTD